MDIPNLKRVRVSSETELTTWLSKNSDQSESVMLVTQCRPSSSKYVSREQVHDALVAHDWVAGPRFTLNATLIGHVISRPASAAPRPLPRSPWPGR